MQNGFFLAVNPPERGMLEDPYFAERNGATQEYRGGGETLYAEHTYLFPESNPGIRRYRSWLKSEKANWVVCFNQAVPTGNEFLHGIKHELAMAIQNNRAAIVVCRCTWNQMQQIGKTIKPFPDMPGVVIGDPRTEIRKKLAEYRLADAPIWAQLPHEERLVPEKYRDAIRKFESFNRKKPLPCCWHAARNVMHQWLYYWCGHLDRALEGCCGILE